LGKWFQEQNDMTKAKNYFEKLADQKIQSQELNLLVAIESYKKGDCLTVTDLLANVPSAQLTENQFLPIYAECLSLKGETDKALALLKSELKNKKFENYLWLEIARLNENFKFEKPEAIIAYKKATENNADPALLTWINKKVTALSGGPVSGGTQ
jgi:tetratricopeptide (TPR) repeat protein